MVQLKKKIKNILGDRHDFFEDYIKDNLPSLHYKRSFKKRINKNKVISNYEISQEVQRKTTELFEGKLNSSISFMWHKAYIAINDIEDHRYIPDDLFYKKIIPKVNRMDLVYAYEDKNNYNNLFGNILMPLTIWKNINGNLYDKDNQPLEKNHIRDILLKSHNKSLVVKPSIKGGGGRGVEVYTDYQINENEIRDLIEKIDSYYKKDYIVQFFLDQHNLLNKIYPHSLNTFRIMTYRNNGAIKVISSVLRMGNLGSKVDNATLGGITVGVHANGLLNSFGTEHTAFLKYLEHPYTKFIFEGTVIPDFSEILEMSKSLHEKLLYFDLASWDIALNEHGFPVLIEVNLGYQGINLHQRNNGPLFGEETVEILESILLQKNLI